MARGNGQQPKTHSANVKFTTVEDVALYERVQAAAQKARRDISDEIVMALEKAYPEVEETSAA